MLSKLFQSFKFSKLYNLFKLLLDPYFVNFKVNRKDFTESKIHTVEKYNFSKIY